MFGLLEPFYNRTIRKIIVGFGSLFSNLVIVRTNYETNVEQERFVVPINFGQKEKYIQALQGDPQNDKKVQISLPIMAYNLTGMRYDPQRKLQTTKQNFALVGGNVVTQYNPVPYNFTFEVYIYVRTIEDGTQIIEQILPFLTPDYTLIISLIPEMNIQRDIPVVLDDVSYDVENEGEREGESRLIIWTLRFTAKGWLFGPVSQGSIIRQVIVNFWDWKNEDGKNLYLVLKAGGHGNFKPSEIVYQGPSLELANAKAQVIEWSNLTNRLLITDATGTFSTNNIVHGAESNTSYTIINYEIIPQNLETVTITPNPPTANADDAYTYKIVKTGYIN